MTATIIAHGANLTDHHQTQVDWQAQLDWIAAQQDAMLERTITLCDINSGSFHSEGVNRVIEAIVPMLERLGGAIERRVLPGYPVLGEDGVMAERPIGDALIVRKRPDAALQILLGGHLDTVFPKDSAFQTVQRLDDTTVNGPGVADLKGGLVIMMTALEALERAVADTPLADQIGWTIFLNPDEEIGSKSSAAMLTELAKQHDLGLVYEPAYPDGGLAGQRKGSGNFEIVVHGRAAHAGREHHLGRNAIAALARATAALDALNGQRDGVTINVGKVTGGGPVNIVPELAVLRLNTRLEKHSDQAWITEQFDRVLAELNAQDGIKATLHGGFTRPPKPVTPDIQRLMDHIADCGKQLGIEIGYTATGGCCDGNNLAAAGLPNIDNLGVVGGDIHSDREYLHTPSLSKRAQLSALLLMRLADGSLPWLGVQDSTTSELHA